MVKRFAWRQYAYMVFALMVLLMCWEANRSQAALYLAPAGTDAAVIPQESIRLRILANSDAPEDQWIKRQVRDAIIEQMNAWVTAPQGIEEARAVVTARLPELNGVVGATLEKYGFDYSYNVELGVVPFPTKMYGNQVYPAGEYEALRVSIGAAEGQNWWCVLFPPLCFVDSEMIAKKKTGNTAYAASAEEVEEKPAAEPKSKEKGKIPAASVAKAEVEKTEAAGEKPEVRFFLWDLMKKIGSLFA
ncbi:stage II sporulation protein R [Paenibacillus sp. GD4]|uniref:stage II sporulation protein R n=1 Tax=Paenibacillus sp. GD4 TaxID=3068890 RepID=UPI002796A0CB|nr:stage II sporulation protein R [Paenibacillus sp. GD4]MDQ1911215.1 stage II sporulation protein R [Paenibacillus sp. GD4]